MHGEAKLTLGGVLLIVGVLVILVVCLWVSGEYFTEDCRRTVCMSNLKGIRSAIELYRSANGGAYPWLYDTITGWDTTPVGTNRNVNPFGTKDNPNNPTPRSITSLMFMIVRQDQPPGLFRCPGDKNNLFDPNSQVSVPVDGDLKEGEYYWDFSRSENVSYSWQAPIWKDGRFYQDANHALVDTAICGDMTPAAVNPAWKSADVSKLASSAIAAQNSPNHKGKQNNILMMAGDIRPIERPDIVVDPTVPVNDNIYTAGGSEANASQWQGSTSLDIRKHLSTRDTFLIGPVGRKAE